MSWTFINIRTRILAGDLPGWLKRHPRKDRVILNILSMPPWVSQKELREFEKEAKRKTRETGVRHVIDHGIPITHPLVCGLSVPWNLRVIPQSVNTHKSNKWNEDQMDLFQCDRKSSPSRGFRSFTNSIKEQSWTSKQQQILATI